MRHRNILHQTLASALTLSTNKGMFDDALAEAILALRAMALSDWSRNLHRIRKGIMGPQRDNPPEGLIQEIQCQSINYLRLPLLVKHHVG